MTTTENTTRRPTRWIRRFATLVVVALLGVLGAPGTGAEVPPPDHDGSGLGDGMLPPGDWTPDQRAFLLDLIERTEAALGAFADIDHLEAIGFHDFGIPAPGGYVHYINPDWIDDEYVLDPEHPESLLFRQTWDPVTGEERMELQAAMFFVPTGTTMETIPADIAWIPGWHIHDDVCVTDDYRFGGLTSPGGTCSEGKPFTGPPMTHVWIVDNACEHRFGMVDVGGMMCDMHMHDPDMHDPDMHDPDMHDPDMHDPDMHDPDMHDPDMHMQDPDHDPGMHDSSVASTGTGHQPVGVGVAPVATALDARPTFTG